MGKKLLVSLALEGKFADSGLQDLDDDGSDLLTTLARELVMKQGVGESADAVWKMLQMAQPKVESAVVDTMVAPSVRPLTAEQDPLWQPASALVFGQSLRAGARRRPAAVPNDNQLALF